MKTKLKTENWRKSNGGQVRQQINVFGLIREKNSLKLKSAVRRECRND